MLADYTDLVRELHKATGSTPPRKYLHARTELQTAHEPAVLKVIRRALARARKRMLKSRATIIDSLVTIHKSDTEDAKAAIRDILEAAFAGSAAELVDIESEIVDDLAKDFKSAYEVNLNFRVVNERAVKYLDKNAKNYFTTLSDSQAEGLFEVVGRALSADDGYRIRDIASSVLDRFLSDDMYFATDDGSRTIGTEAWAMAVARSETARAASYAQQSVLESLNLQTWQWQSSSYCCDECQTNDNEIVAIGDDFTSGDSEPPVHPNCMCVVLPVQDEMDSIDSSDENADSTNENTTPIE